MKPNNENGDKIKIQRRYPNVIRGNTTMLEGSLVLKGELRC